MAFLLRVTPETCRPDDLAEAVRWLAAGGVVAFPTDTFYGLAVDPSSPTAVQALFDVKGRDSKMAVPLLGSSVTEVEAWCGALAGTNARLAARWWPGPLSLIFDSPERVAAEAHGGEHTIAVRVPAHPLARALAAACGGLITATSANRSGEPPAATVDALTALAADPRVLIVDGGRTPGGLASTIVDARGARVRLVREGAIAWSRVLESIHE